MFGAKSVEFSASASAPASAVFRFGSDPAESAALAQAPVASGGAAFSFGTKASMNAELAPASASTGFSLKLGLFQSAY